MKRVAVYWLPWSECTMSPAGGRRTARARRLVDQVFGHGLAHVRVGIGGAGHKRAGLLGAQAVGFEHAADAPAAHGVAFGLHFRPQPAGAVALAVVDKGFAYRHLPGRLDRRLLSAAVPNVVRGRGHAQHLAEPADRHVGSALRDVLVGAHRVGWPKMTKAFFKISSSCSARFRRARRARTSGSRATSSLPTSATSWACCQR